LGPAGTLTGQATGGVGHIHTVASDDELHQIRAEVKLYATSLMMWSEELFVACKWLDDDDPYKILVAKAYDHAHAKHGAIAKKYQAALQEGENY
jgi:hypothetical protein